jgi:hypothetical protein
MYPKLFSSFIFPKSIHQSTHCYCLIEVHDESEHYFQATVALMRDPATEIAVNFVAATKVARASASPRLLTSFVILG